METNKLHRGRMIDHLQLVVGDLEKSFAFYESVFKALEIPLGAKTESYFYFDELFVSGPESPAAAGKLTGRTHLAFQASNNQMVEKFHSAGLEAGGRDNGKPGMRAYHPGYYAAFLLDPDGNNIEAVYHGPAKRSAPSIEITF